MKKVLGIIFFTLLTTFLCSEDFKGVYDIKFGQNPSEVKTNIEKNGFTEEDFSLYSSKSGNKEIVFGKKQTSFYGVECKFLTVIAVFDQNEKMNEILVFCENYTSDADDLFEQINKLLDIYKTKYNFILSSEEDYNTKEAFLMEFSDNKSITFQVCNNHGLVLYDFKYNDSSLISKNESYKITWSSVTDWEYLGEDSKFSYLLDLYEDFKDAKIDEKKISNIKKSNYQVKDYLISADCTVAKLKIISKDNSDTNTIILFLDNNELFEGTF